MDGKGDMAFFVVPRKGDPTELGGFHVGGNFIVFLECCCQVLKIFQVGVLDKEIIHNQGEDNGVGLVLEEAWCGAGFHVPCLEAGDKEVAGNLSGLGQSIHAFVNSGVNVVIGGDIVVQVVLGPYVLRDVLSPEAYILGVGKDVIEVEVLDIDTGGAGSWC
jgi:hypothetical protein